MEFDESIKKRRSIRKYQDKPVAESTIHNLLDLARHAPSSMNGQPWHFIVVRESETKKKIAEIKNKYCPAEKRSYKADFLEKAPVIVVVCVDQERSFDRNLESSVLAAAYIMLAACARGLSSVYMSAYGSGAPGLSEEIGRALKLPKNIDPITIIPLGYPEGAPEPKTLRPLEEMLHFERF
jgi:nitroreductase